MSVAKKNTIRRAAAKRLESNPVIITKSLSVGGSAFPKKVKEMNALLSKAKLLP